MHRRQPTHRALPRPGRRAATAALVSLALVLAACGGDDDDDSGSATTEGDAAVETTAAAATTDAPATTAGGATETTAADEMDTTEVPAGMTYSEACDTSPGVTDTEIKLGALVDLSGATASGAKPTYDGMAQYFAYVNETMGGLNGREIVLDAVDTAYDANTHISELDAMSDSVLTVALSWGTEPAAAAAPRAAELCMVAMGGGISTSSAELPGHFIAAPPYAIEVLNGVDWAVNNLEGDTTRWAVVSLPGPVGEEVASALSYAESEYGIEVVENVTAALSDQDLSPAVAKLDAADPDVILLATIAPQTPQILSLYQGDAQIIGFTPAYNPGLLNTPAAEALKAVHITSGATPWSADAPGIAAARDWVAESMPEALTQSAFLSGWEGAAMIYEGLRRADEAGDLTRGGLARGLFSIQDADPAGFGHTVTLGAEGRPHGVPTLETYITLPNPDVDGTLEPVDGPFVGVAAETYFGS